jgi:hypothetical protein
VVDQHPCDEVPVCSDTRPVADASLMSFSNNIWCCRGHLSNIGSACLLVAHNIGAHWCKCDMAAAGGSAHI